MENIFAKRRARLLAMKAMRENYVPGEKLVTCPHCGGESQRKDVAAALSVCPLCGYHFPMGAYYRLSSVLDPGSFRELHEKLTASDPLRFPGYGAKLDGARRKTGMNEAVDVYKRQGQWRRHCRKLRRPARGDPWAVPHRRRWRQPPPGERCGRCRHTGWWRPWR